MPIEEANLIYKSLCIKRDFGDITEQEFDLECENLIKLSKENYGEFTINNK